MRNRNLPSPVNLHPAEEMIEYSSRRGRKNIKRSSRVGSAKFNAALLASASNTFDISQRISSVRTADMAMVKEKLRADMI